MTSGPMCRCLLCRLENQLAAELDSQKQQYNLLLSAATNGLGDFGSPFELLSHLKATNADPSSDDLYRDLLALRPISPSSLRS